MITYRRKQDVIEQSVGGDTMLFDERNDRVHVLNHSAAFVWACLENDASLDQIIGKVRGHYEPASMGDDLAAILQQTLNSLVDKGLIESAPEDANRIPAPAGQ